jgi:hypothetical protein
MSFPDFAKKAGYVLVATLVAMLRAKTDIYVLDRIGRSPCHVAREGPRVLENGWREALELAGLDKREVYAKSGVRWTETPSDKKSPKDLSEEMVEILSQIETEDMSHKVYEEMLVKRVQAGADIYYVCPQRGTPTAVARHREADGLWKSVLRCCGYDPVEVYAKSNKCALLDSLPNSSSSAASSTRSRRASKPRVKSNLPEDEFRYPGLPEWQYRQYSRQLKSRLRTDGKNSLELGS